jgi:nicotinate phosphoribosyltransferase
VEVKKMSVPSSPLFTDLYQLTMMQAYKKSGMNRCGACFDLFFRENPFNGGYTVFAGLLEAVQFLQGLRFSEEDIAYLKTLGLFQDDFLKYLETFKFTGEIYSVREGSIVFPLEPLLRVQGPLDECQLVETALLNTINFQSLIATKSARICHEAGEDNVIEFGLRRAQGHDGGLTASRAAYIGGCVATSNVEAGKVYGIPVRGTHAHSWVMAFPDELTAFRNFVKVYPKNSVLLVDTYDTLKSGVPNAVKVGLEMKECGEKLAGIRLDSGDLAYLSIESRKILDEAGLNDTKIICSSDLDEYIIHDLKIQGARADMYGVGTNLVSSKGDSALSGVYKLSAIHYENSPWEMKIKKTEGLKKSTLPGTKQVWRLKNKNNEMIADWVELDTENPDFSKGVLGYHPVLEYEKKYYHEITSAEPMLECVFKEGKIQTEFPKLTEIRDYLKAQFKTLHPTMRRLLNPHIYKVSLGPRLHEETHRLRTSNV